MNRLLNHQEVAGLLGVRPSTIYQWTHIGYIPHVKLGKMVRFDENAIEEWVRKRSDAGRINRTPNIGQYGI